MARFRGLIQAAATLATNIHLPNFAKGGIYQGAGKAVCVPGLNCYSCPAASGACPIGSFQSVVGSSKFSFSYYVTGTLILIGVLLGRLRILQQRGGTLSVKNMQPPIEKLFRLTGLQRVITVEHHQRGGRQ